MNRIKSIFILSLILLFVTAWADESSDPASTRTDKDVTTAPRPEGIATATVATGEQQPTALEPSLQAIEDNYRLLLKDLQTQLANAQTPEENEALQTQAMELKEEWSLALANRQLELARARNDEKAIASITEAIENMNQHRTGGVK